MFILFDITPDFENAFKFSSEERRILMQGKGVGKDVVVEVVDIFSIFYPVGLKKSLAFSYPSLAKTNISNTSKVVGMLQRKIRTKSNVTISKRIYGVLSVL